jgi:hypothetical protein
MTNLLKAKIQSTNNDELYTPEYAIQPILKYLDKSKVYWEPTDFGSSNITKVLKENGFKIISTNILEYDFLLHEPEFHYDCIITNPPYSIKDLFIERAYNQKKDFIYLLPLTALEGVKRHHFFKKYGIQVVIFDRRINFIGGNNKKTNWFNTSWFSNNQFPKDLIFETLDKKVN